MPSRKRVVAILAAIVVGVPVLVICGFFAILSLDERRIEAGSEECKALIPAIQEFKNRAGRFPNAVEADQISPKLAPYCGYRNLGREFWMGIAGEGINMQVYGYSSEINRWFWD